MKIEVDERGALKVDSKEKKVEEFDQAFLEGLVAESLAGNVEYSIEGSMPLAKFFTAIKEGTAPGSELKKLQDEIEAKTASRENGGTPEDEEPEEHEAPELADDMPVRELEDYNPEDWA